MHQFTIYRDVPVRIICDKSHVHKIGGRICGCRHKDWGDLPVVTFNEITQKMMAVVNPRGRAYARRNDVRLRNDRRGSRPLEVEN